MRILVQDSGSSAGFDLQQLLPLEYDAEEQQAGHLDVVVRHQYIEHELLPVNHLQACLQEN